MQPDDTFLTSFTIDPSGNPSVGDSGIIGGVETIDFTSKAAKPILYGSVENGAILPGNKFDVFTFVGTAGDVVTINMSRSNGSLDTLLYLIGPDGFEVANNDDAAPGENTDSSIRELTLPLTGTYTIIATHYGTIYGGTTGGYSLTLSRDEE